MALLADLGVVVQMDKTGTSCPICQKQKLVIRIVEDFGVTKDIMVLLIVN